MPNAGEYFAEHSHDYHPGRLKIACRWISRLYRPGDTLFDVGCGTGRVLKAMRKAGLEHLAGCDTAAAALEAAARKVDFEAHRGSILDDEFVSGLGRHRFVTMAAVLHHVVGATRAASRRDAVAAIANSLRLVAPGGRLVIMEPTYEPKWAMTLLFWAKRALTGVFGNHRIELGRWNNLGAPLVSYYTADEVAAMVERAGGRVVRRKDKTASVRTLPRLLGVRRRRFTTLMVVPRHLSKS